ncbi:macrolide export ATP-binding/permease protein MacB 1 [Cellulomonas chitinilytica]|uniref:Macrolide export ATP-binding/permease protein MacB 1 n=1 Tax=Cellulomonas chitinilytica TaxID=398759 RepID=A0A919TYQ1_9CELL|nr:ATP-binding cassette domain-containing protein [Cellulomonas chitinilytica]GIG20840.1 macrolide export ATP-binding/permease protein MacB 1 [Cellulomonas chitinilytica]
MADLELSDVTQTFGGDSPVRALRGVSLTIRQGEFVAIEGPSGSGKSTLLNQLALLQAPTSGDYLIDGVSMTRASERRRARARSRLFGFVFQSFHLLDARPVVDSVELGLFYRGVPARERRRRALEALAAVGLSDKAWRLARHLSGGERQRAAVARALAVGAPLIVADEPTGNLDSRTSASVIGLLSALSEQGRTVVLVTHDHDVAAATPRQLVMRDGCLISDSGHARVDLADEPAGIQTAPGRDSHVRAVDLWVDALRSLAARPGKTGALVVAVGVAVGLAIATLGISETAAGQVSDRFDADRNVEVTVVDKGRAVDPFVPAGPAEVAARLGQLTGVQAAGALVDYGHHVSAGAGDRGVSTGQVYAATDGTIEAARLEVDWAARSHVLGPGQALLGTYAAEELDIGPLDAGAVVAVDGRELEVVGVITRSPREENLLAAVVLTDADANRLFAPHGDVAQLIVTVPGAAPQVARQAPLVVRPTDPEAVTVVLPPDPQRLRAGIESDLRTTLLVLTAVAVLASVVGLANSMVMSVIHRSAEFGLRRAIGARRKHVVLGVISEAMLIGLAGALIGLFLGIAAVLATTIAQRWQPVLDLRLVPVAIATGVVVGGVSGVVSALRAARIQPADALRT